MINMGKWVLDNPNQYKLGLSIKQKENWKKIAKDIYYKCLDAGFDPAECTDCAVERANKKV